MSDKVTEASTEVPAQESQESSIQPTERKSLDEISSSIIGTTDTSNNLTGSDSGSHSADTAADADFLENYVELSQKRLYSKKLEDSDYYWDNNDKIRQEFEATYGTDKGREEFNNYYKEVSKTHQQLAEDETDKVIMNSGMGIMFFADEEVEEVGQSSMSVVNKRIDESLKIGDILTDAQVSYREAARSSRTYLNDKGDVVKLSDTENLMSWGSSEILLDDNHTSEDGRQIVGFTHTGGDGKSRGLATVQAVYEGDIPQGEILSFWDAADTMLASDSLSENAISAIPTTVARTVLGLTTDLVMGTSEMLASIGTLLDEDDENTFIHSMRDAATRAGRLKVSKSDHDQENMVTWSNSLDLVANVVGQLYLGGSVAKGVGKLAGSLGKNAKILQVAQKAAANGKQAKAAELFAKYESRVAKPSRISSLMAMSLMAGTGIKQEAREAGFSEDATAGIFLAFLPAMFAANAVSNIAGPALSNKAKKLGMQKAIREMISVTDEAALASNKAKFAFGKKLVKSMESQLNRMRINSVIGKGTQGVLANAANEAMEEEIELIAEEGLKHLATSIARVTSQDPTTRPKFDTIWDEGYFSKMMPEIIMSGIGGAIGGGFAKFTGMGGVDENSLPFQGSDQDKLKRIVLAGGQNEATFLKTLRKSFDSGALGSHDFLVERDADGNLKRTSEDRDKATQPTLAEANYRAIMFQYNYYKSQIGSFQGTYEDFIQENPEIAGNIDVQEELHERVKKNFEALNALYNKTKPGAQNIDEGAGAQNIEGQQQAEQTAAAEEAKRKQQAKKKGKQQSESGADVDTTTNERTESTDNDLGKASPITDAARVRAGAMNISEADAQEILDREDAMKDMLTGKTLEEDYINATIKNNEELSFLADLEGHESAVDFLNKLQRSDVEHHKMMSDRFEDFRKKAVEVNEIVKNASSEEDLDAILANRTKNGTIPLTPEDTAILRSQMRIAANDMVTPEEYAIEGENLYRENGLEDYLEADFINDFIQRVSYGEVEIDDMVANETDKFFKYGMYKRISNNLAVNDVNHLLDVTVPTDIDAFRDALMEEVNNNYIDPYEIDQFVAEGGLDQIVTLALDAVTDRTNLVSEESDMRQKVSGLKTKVDEIEANLSEDVPRPVGSTVVEFLGFDLTDVDGVVNTLDVNLLDKAQRMMKEEVDSSLGDFEIFRNKSGAEDLLKAINIRKGQLNTIKTLLDNEALSKLRIYNSNTLSNEEYYAPLDEDKYTKYSKFVSGFIMDPVETFLLNKKEVLTTDEQKKLDNIIHDYNYMFGSKDQISSGLQEQLDEAKRIATHLIGLAEASVEGGRMSDIYNTSVVKTANAVNSALNDVDLSFDPELHNLSLKLGELDSGDISDENAIQSWKTMRAIADALYNTDRKEDIINELDKSRGSVGVTLVASFLSSDYNKFSTIFNSIVESEGAKQEDPSAPITPTISQEMMAFSTFAFATGEGDYVVRSGNDSNDINAIFASGSLGTGKTTMIMGYAVKAIQRYQNEAILQAFADGKLEGNFGDYNKVLLAANSADQRANMESLAITDFNVSTKSSGATQSFSLEQLLDIVQKDDALDDVSTIIYDEVTFIQAGDGIQPEADLNVLLRRIQELNESREAKGLPLLKFIGLGDAKQGGFHKGMESGKENIHIDYNAISNERQTISKLDVTQLPPLTYSFRGYVDELNAFITHVKKWNENAVLGGASPDVMESRYGKINNDPRGRLGGVELVRDATKNIYNDVLDIESQIKKGREEGKEFIVGIVDTYTSVEQLPAGTAIRALAEKYPENFKVRTMSQAQGAEFDYTLINLPEDFLPKLGDYSGREAFKFNLLATMVGRSRFYARVAVSDKVNIDSTQGNVAMANQELTTEFRKKWKAVREGSSEDIALSEDITHPENTPKPEPTVEPEESTEEGKEEQSEKVKESEKEAKKKEESKEIQQIREAVIDQVPNVEVSSEVVTIDGDQAAYLEDQPTDYEYIADELDLELVNDQVLADLDEQLKYDMENAQTVDERQAAFETFSTLSGINNAQSELYNDVSEDQAQAIKAMFNDVDSGDTSDLRDISDRARILDKNGISIAYSEIFKNGEKRQLASNYLKRMYARDIFNPTTALQQDDIQTHTTAALGIGPRGKAAMEDYDYSIVSHRYKRPDHYGGTDGFMETGHLLVGTTKEGKKFVIGMLPSTYKMDDDSPTKALLDQRAQSVKDLQTTFTNATAGREGSSEYNDQGRFMSDFVDAIPAGSVAGRQHTINFPPEDRAKKLTIDVITNGAVYLETDVTYDIDDIIKGISPGALVKSSAELKARLLETVTDREEQAYLNEMPLQDDFGRSAAYVEVENILEEEVTINTSAMDALIKKNIVNPLSVNGKPFIKTLNEEGKATYTMSLKIRNRNVPVSIEEGSSTIIPIYGFDKYGYPIQDNDNLVLSQDDELKLLTGILNEKQIDAPALLNDTYMEETSLDLSREILADQLKYDLTEMDNTIGVTSKFAVASKHNLKEVSTNFDKLKIPLNKFIGLMEGKGVSFSRPLVFTKNNSNSKSLEGNDAGKVFIFYTHNQHSDYDLSDPRNVQRLEKHFTEIGKSIDASQDITPETIQAHLGDGIGVMQLDYEYNSVAKLMSYFKQSEQKDLSKFQKLIAPSKSAVNKRLTALIGELSDLTRSTFSGFDKEGSYKRIDRLRQTNSELVNGVAEPIQVLDPTKKTELISYLQAMMESDDATTNNAAAHLMTTIGYITEDSHMGQLMLTSKLDPKFPARIRNLFGLPTSAERVREFKRIQEDATKEEISALEELGVGTKPISELLSIGTTGIGEGDAVNGRLVLSNGNPQIRSRNPELDVLKYVPLAELNNHAISKLNVGDRFSFNITNFMRLLSTGIDGDISPEVADKTVEMLDTLLSNYTLPGTLNKGLRIPPSYTNTTDAKASWGYLDLGGDVANETTRYYSGKSDLGNRLLTNVKSISGPGVYMDTNAIAEALANASKNIGSDTTDTTGADRIAKLVNDAKTAVNTHVNDAIDSIANAVDKKSLRDIARGASIQLKNLVKNIQKVGGSEAEAKQVLAEGQAKIDQANANRINKFKGTASKIKAIPLDTLRKEGIGLIIPAELRNIVSRTNADEMVEIDKQLSYLPITLDDNYANKVFAKIKDIASVVRPQVRKPLLDSIQPTITELSSNISNEQGNVEAARKYVQDNNVELEKHTDAVEQNTMTSLNNYTDAPLADRTGLFITMMTSDSDSNQSVIESHLKAQMDSDIDPIALKYRIMRSLRAQGYLLTDPKSLDAVQRYGIVDPAGFEQFFKREDVQELLRNTQESTIIKLYSGTSDVTSVLTEFQSDVDAVMQMDSSPTDKKNYLQALLDLVPAQFPDGITDVGESVKQLISQNMATLEAELNGGNPITMGSLLRNSDTYSTRLNDSQKATIDAAMITIDGLVGSQDISLGNMMLALNGKSYKSDDFVQEFSNLIAVLNTKYAPKDANMIAKFIGAVKKDIHKKNNKKC